MGDKISKGGMGNLKSVKQGAWEKNSYFSRDNLFFWVKSGYDNTSIVILCTNISLIIHDLDVLLM